jgi:hypothetical protein
MKRTMILSTAVLLGWLGLVSATQAQVFIRAPFVRVAVGDGVSVRAPFVNLWIPGDGPYYGPAYGPVYGPGYYGPRVVYSPQPGVVQQQQPQSFNPPTPQPVPQPQPQQPKPPIKDDAPPQPIQPVQAPTLESFAKTFQAKAGTYEVTILNPVSKQPSTVRFILLDGAPRRVHVTRDSIEFVYGLRQWVRIEFDRDGATVTAR